MAPQFESAKEFREVIDQIFTMMDEDPEMGPEAARRRRARSASSSRLRPGREHPRRRATGEDGNLYWEWSDDVDWEPEGPDDDVLGGRQQYFQGKENVAMAIARRRIKTGGDVKAALA